MTGQQIENAFTYHTPTQAQAGQYGRIRSQAKGLAELLAVECPPGRELDLAINGLEVTLYWANAAIARRGGETAVGAGGGARSGTGGAGGGGNG